MIALIMFKMLGGSDVANPYFKIPLTTVADRLWSIRRLVLMGQIL